MSDDTRPDSLPVDADAWISDFPEKLEQEFLQIAKFTFSRDANICDYQRALTFAFRRLLAETGMPEADMQATFSDAKFGWTEAKNKRRCELIEKVVDEELSFDESLELESLTFQLRYANWSGEKGRVEDARQKLEALKSQPEQSESKPG
ncbi:MAG: hypothetical protein KDB22_05490 [Planctomycetales bacterium]|nr:hypothetical protein [Planctomycetales bacterium]